MGADGDCRIPRRSLLVALAPALSGCVFGSCTIGKSEFETDAVERFTVSGMEANLDTGGTCDFNDGRTCLQTTIEVDPERVARMEARTTDGEVVVTHGFHEGELYALEIGSFQAGGSARREVAVFDHDDEEVESAEAFADC